MLSEKKKYLALGLMSGTSLDGIDAACIVSDGEVVYEYLGGHYVPYPPFFQNQLQLLIQGDYSNKLQTEKVLTELHAEVVQATKKKLGIKNLDLIGFHGQTIRHNPKLGITEQIGDGPLLAKLTGVNVIYNFRANDVKHGGEGAPLVPIFLSAIVRDHKINAACFLNIGGVSNICYYDNNHLIAFDIGPGNAPMNDLVQRLLNLPYDDKGHIAASGKPDMELVNRFLDNEFYKFKPPKSLDRNHFNFGIIADSLPLHDALASINYIIAWSLKSALSFLPVKPDKIIVYGGGIHNINLIQVIERVCALDAIPFSHINDKINPDFVESYAFAFLAVRSLLKLPITFPSTTGVKQPQPGGVFCPFSTFLEQAPY